MRTAVAAERAVPLNRHRLLGVVAAGVVAAASGYFAWQPGASATTVTPPAPVHRCELAVLEAAVTIAHRVRGADTGSGQDQVSRMIADR
ncbi:hypothetical protein [Nocardia sp. NPDC052566]|uniref:hypothetical protein n=1 Tax=Nocardia sp. NPDC052566 TaxID=3364330 RepID=UPI0037C70ECB